MGVTGLWTVVKPCARPIRLETLNKKRLAVDASIWIYQFLKAVRDKEGNALRNAHIVGFFRRICKLLYFGIKPVFVFDGGAPELKRQTIAARRKRREGRHEDASKTAERLLTIQLQKAAEEEAAKSRTRNNRDDNEEPLPQDLVYASETLIPVNERQKNRQQFRKKDAYHLPELEVSLEEMGAPNDPRIMSHEELEAYAKQFSSGEVVNFYDFSKIDFDSPFFLSLPASDRYNILSAARLRSRLRMGYSKEQLDSMFPNRMEFSKFQIDRVKERNDLTQRLMNLNGMNDDILYGLGTSQRIASEKNREYVLVKDDSVEGGWALGVLGNKGEGRENQPIDVDRYDESALPATQEELDDDDDDAFEDVPIEGLNRLPTLPIFKPGVFDQSLQGHSQEIARKREALHDSRKRAATQREASREEADDNSLFVRQDAATIDSLFEEAPEEYPSEDEALQQAIEMSLETYPEGNFDTSIPPQKEKVPPASSAIEDAPLRDDFSDSDNEMDLFAALSKSKVTKPSAEKKASPPRFAGLLPFEPLKPLKPRTTQSPATVQDNAGGFERPFAAGKRKKETEPLPPWFAGTSQTQEFIGREPEDQYSGVGRCRSAPQERILNKSQPQEVITLDDDDDDAEPTVSVKETPEQVTGDLALEIPKSTLPSVTPATTDQNNEVELVPNPETPQLAGASDKASPPSIHSDEWPASDVEDKQQKPESPTPEFEDVNVSKPAKDAPQLQPSNDIPAQETAEDRIVDLFPDEGDVSDPEDAELMHQLSIEAEEHARFASALNSKSQADNVYDYEQELKQLRSQQKKDRRDADEVTQIMVSECQQLLRLFGLPYITAPMEAEAQCAELVSLGLVDGIVTDDSDIFLFGGNRIYKNMFNQAKYVECYLTSDLEKEYALDREKLIRFAHLLGSDYTEGIPGIGPVTALEILTEFSTLEDFRDWWSQVQKAASIPDDVHSAFRKKFKKKATKLFLPPSFPDKRVDIAYLQPEIDPDPSAFQWGVPDLNALRGFLMATVGWSQERTDEVLVPVIRDMNQREQEGTQSNITGFFQGPQGAGAFAPRRRTGGRTRMEKAFGRLRHQAEAKRKDSNPGADHVDHPDQDEPKNQPPAKKPRRTAKRKAAGDGGVSIENSDREGIVPRQGTQRKRCSGGISSGS